MLLALSVNVSLERVLSSLVDRTLSHCYTLSKMSGHTGIHLLTSGWALFVNFKPIGSSAFNFCLSVVVLQIMICMLS